MAEIDEECVFVAKADSIKFTTQTNGDMIVVSGLNLSKEQAASLAWLINNMSKNVVFEVKLQV